VKNRRAELLLFGAVFLSYLTVSLLIPHLGGNPDDETAYVQYAERLTHGHYADASTPESFLWRGPGLPVVLAPFEAVDAPIGIPRLIPPLCLFAAVVLFYRLLTLRVSRSAALAGAAALGLYYPFLRQLGYVYTEPPAILLVVLALYFWVRRSNGAGNRALVGAGLALGALALTRLEYGYVLLACLLLAVGAWLVGRGGAVRPARDGAAVCAIALALCVPWLAYTYAKTDKVFYWSNSGSLSLYWMASPDPDDLGDPHVAAAVFTNPNLASHRPLFRRLRTMDPVEADEELRHIAREQIKDHPQRYARNLAYNTSRLILNFPFSFKQQTAAPLFYALPNGLLLVFGGLAIAALARARRWWGLVAAPAVFGVIGFAAHVPVAGYPRYWFPIVPIAVWVAVLGISELLARGVPPRPQLVEPASP
jgi:4-amino-4-deoxy-L-arabinose transferase-like glycosyltransferase